MGGVGGGRLREAAGAPPTGERTHVLVTTHGFAVEQILSGRVDAPVDYHQDHDEWVVVLEGGAVLEVEGDERTLGPGDWMLIPANVPHQLVSAQAGTSWIAVRGPHDDEREGRSR